MQLDHLHSKYIWGHCPRLDTLPLNQLIEKQVTRLQVEEKGVARSVVLGKLEGKAFDVTSLYIYIF